ncbi:MAG: tRNA lysidine(34) synthetase TilS [Candidatus Marinimicrobia bacterium]|nr:tRNA lysidine(34) synthetase TilS [Candidatus Neomarinimicrobiota bacterium]
MKNDKNITKFKKQFVQFARENDLLKKGDSILAAVSGGVDSIVMLHLLHEISEETGISLTVVHFNHQLRDEESKRDAEFVKNLSEKLNISCTVKLIDVKSLSEKEGISVQDAGHRLRRKAQLDLVEEYGFDSVATAHHKDDQLETLLMRLISGAGPQGMSGISIKEESYIRPLLFADKQQITQYAERKKIEWVEDSSNRNNKYIRNKIRLEVIPTLKEINPSAAEVASRTAITFGRLTSDLEDLSDKILEKSILSEGKSEIILAIPELSNYFNMIGYFMINRALKRIDRESPTVLNRQFNDLAKLVETGSTGSEIILSDGYRVLKDRDRLIIYNNTEDINDVQIKIGIPTHYRDMVLETNRVQWDSDSQFPQDVQHEVVDNRLIDGGVLKLRRWKEGDRIHPLGLKGTKKVSDILTEAKMPLNRKRAFPIVEYDGDVVWVCGIRLSDQFKVTENTTDVVHLKIRNLNFN